MSTEPAPAETAVKAPIWETFTLKRLPQLRQHLLGTAIALELYNFQQYAIYRALTQRVFVIALSTGLGKTVCSYATYFYYKLKFPKTRLIIVTNKSAVLQYRNELDKFFDHDLSALAIHPKMSKLGAKDYRGARYHAYEMFGGSNPYQDVDVLVMNYATFRKDKDKLVQEVAKAKAQGIHIFSVFDEATAFKNISTATHKAVAAISSLSDRVLGLTATLTKGKLEEIYGVYKALGVQLSPTKEAFEDQFCVVFQHSKMRHIKRIDGYKNTASFLKLIQPICIVLRKIDVAKFLPAFTPRKVMLEHSEDQYKLIADIYSGIISVDQLAEGDGEDYSDLLSLNLEPVQAEQALNPFGAPMMGHNNPPDDEPIEDPSVKKVARLSETGFIKRALQDPRLVTKRDKENFKVYSPKTAELIRMLDEEFTDEKIVVYTPSLQYLKMMRDAVANAAHLPAWYKNSFEIHGEIEATERERMKDEFASDKSRSRLFFINDAGIESINLQAASVMIVAALPTSGGNMVQLAGRISRIGSTHSNLLLIYLLTQDSQDEDEYLIIQQQMQLMASVMGEAEKGLLDWEVLRSAEAERQKEQDISQEELEKQSMSKLLLHKRKRRAAFYDTRSAMYSDEA